MNASAVNQTRQGGRQARRKDRTLRAILEAAERQVARGGFADARIEEIAEEADVAIGSIYNHFGSKQGLHTALLERALDLHADYLERVPESGPPLERLLATAEAHGRFAGEHPGCLRTLTMPPRDGAERAAAELATRRAALTELVAEAIAAGDVRPMDPAAAAGLLWSAWTGMALLGSGASTTDAALDVVAAGLAVDPGRARDLIAGLRARGGPDRDVELVSEPVEERLQAEIGPLALWSALLSAKPGKSPPALRERIAGLSNTIRGSNAVLLRQQPIPHAYRVALRHLGVDPDTDRTPIEAAVLDRLMAGGFKSTNLLDDALLVALVDTGVPVTALDADRLDGGLQLRLTRRGERMGGDGAPLPPGRPVIADASRPVAELIGGEPSSRAPTPSTERIVLAAPQVKGVPTLAVHEAIWGAVQVLRGAQG